MRQFPLAHMMQAPAHSLPVAPEYDHSPDCPSAFPDAPGASSPMRLSRKWAPLLSSHTEVGYSIPKALDFALSLDDMNCYQAPCGVLTLEIRWHLKTE